MMMTLRWNKKRMLIVICINICSKDYKCPITKSLMTTPMRAPCGHMYEKTAIEQVINKSPSKIVACPVAGCNYTKISTATLEEDYAAGAEIARLKLKPNTSQLTQRAHSVEDEFEDIADDD